MRYVDLVEARESEMGVRRVARGFSALLARGATTGFLELVQPATLSEACAEQRLIRDIEEGHECGRCGGHTVIGFRCETCREEHRVATNKTRVERRENCLCIFCGNAMPCAVCTNRSNNGIKTLRMRRRANGLCELCGRAAIRGGLCAEHRPLRLAKLKAREAKKRETRKAAGLCVDCGRETAVSGGSRGVVCRERQQLAKRRRKLAKSE